MSERWWDTLLSRLRARPPSPVDESESDADARARLEARCTELQESLDLSERRLRERSELLYELQRHYSSEHFNLQESMRKLNTERMRNAGMFGDRDIIISRSKELQKRIQSLKERLRRHETVDDLYFDAAPIVIENEDDGTEDRGNQTGR